MSLATEPAPVSESASKLLLLLLLPILILILILHRGQWFGTPQLSLGQDNSRPAKHGKERK
jgi:hypothetical protein